MNKETEALIDRIPLLNKLIAFLKRIPLGKGQQFSLYDLLELYTIGIVRGALTYRASAISYSFFVAIFPFLLVVLNLIPYVGPIIGAVVISVLTISNFMDADLQSVILPKTLYVLIGFLFTQFIDNVFSQPIIFSNSMKSSPLEIFIVTLISGTLFGIVVKRELRTELM